MFNLPVKNSVGVGSSVLLALLLVGCDANTYMEPPPPAVTIATALRQDVIDYLEFTGTLVASERAEVRARVSGILQNMHFEPGAKVEEGALLFTIDPAEYQADLQAAEAELTGAKSNYDRASIEYVRANNLYKQNAGAEAEVVKWRVEKELTTAEILRAKAKVDRAELNLGYTQVVAPFSGRIGRNEVDIGNLVGEGEATLLTDVTRYHPMFVYFNLNERDLLRIMPRYAERYRRMQADPTEISPGDLKMPVMMGLANEEGFPHEGILDFSESGLDADTGTIQLRGAFKNDEVPPKLLPGLFARVRLPVATRENMPLVSERAIGQDQSGVYLLIVTADNKVEKVNIRAGQKIDGLIVIEDGLREGDRVVVKGLQRARPGRVVTPELTDMQSLTTSALQKAAEAASARAPVQKTDAQPPAGDPQ
ncbi:efflux RND transporter periplasmic adaptor subunit [Pseudomonadota bacterium]